MSVQKSRKPNYRKALVDKEQSSRKESTRVKVEKQNCHAIATAVFSKEDSRYWMVPGRLYKPPRSANYSVRILFKGERHAVNLNTSNKAAGEGRAASIYADLVRNGWKVVLAKHRTPDTPKEIKTSVGAFIDAARAVSEASETTFTAYARALRQIAGEVTGLEKDDSRFGPKHGGSTAYRKAIDSLPLDALTPDSIQQWKLRYPKKAKNPAQERSRKTSCNSIMRQAKSLFAERVLRFIKIPLPSPLPFEGVEYFPRQSSKYISKIDAAKIMALAGKELREKHPASFLVLLLALGAGLRRGEIDGLTWDQVDTQKRVIRVEVTDVSDLKTSDSRGEVGIDEIQASVLQGFKAKAKGKGFVIPGAGKATGSRKWGQNYRAESAYALLIAWLRKKGITARKPLHELRKELGALVTQELGIYAASRVLRHSNPQTTALHYSDLKTLPVIELGKFLPPANVTPMERSV